MNFSVTLNLLVFLDRIHKILFDFNKVKIVFEWLLQIKGKAEQISYLLILNLKIVKLTKLTY